MVVGGRLRNRVTYSTQGSGVRHELGQPLDGFAEPVASTEADADVLRRTEQVAGCEQHACGCRLAAEAARAAARDEPRERRTATRGPDPGELFRMPVEELARQGQVFSRDASGACVDLVAVEECQYDERFADRRAGSSIASSTASTSRVRS